MVYGKHKRKTLENKTKEFNFRKDRTAKLLYNLQIKTKKSNGKTWILACNFFLQNRTFIFQTINGKPISSNCFSRSVDMFPFR